MTQDIINDVFRNNLRSNQELLNGYIIIINGKIFCDGLGKFIYKSRTAAIKGFYNHMKWRSSNYAARHAPTSLRSERYPYYIDPPLSTDDYNLLRDFTKFKRELIRNYNFQVIRLR